MLNSDSYTVLYPCQKKKKKHDVTAHINMQKTVLQVVKTKQMLNSLPVPITQGSDFIFVYIRT